MSMKGNLLSQMDMVYRAESESVGLADKVSGETLRGPASQRSTGGNRGETSLAARAWSPVNLPDRPSVTATGSFRMDLEGDEVGSSLSRMDSCTTRTAISFAPGVREGLLRIKLIL